MHLPSEEVSDLVQRQSNHFPELEAAALADEDHDILGAQRPSLGGHPRRFVDPRLDLPCEAIGEQAGGIVEPTLLASRDLLGLDRGDGRPEHHAARPRFRLRGFGPADARDHAQGA